MVTQRVRNLCGICILAVLALPAAFAGDDASGSTPYRLDLSQRFSTYSMTANDEQWSANLAKKFKYNGGIVHFVRTSLPLQIGERTVQGNVYQSVEHPDVFYVLEGDAMLKIGAKWPYNPGVGGFSIHAPKSKNFIVCLNYAGGGVPFLSGSPVTKAVVSWKGDPQWNRLPSR
jgi:hypothetical protein